MHVASYCLMFQTLAIVGESGSGKSTVIALLQRFYDPDSGQITIDGVEIQNLKLRWLRQQMGLVSQEPVLFNDTIRANVAYGKEGNANEAEVITAAKLANAHGFISGLQQVKPKTTTMYFCEPHYCLLATKVSFQVLSSSVNC